MNDRRSWMTNSAWSSERLYNACSTGILNIKTDGKAGRPPFDPSQRFSAFANGFSNTGQGIIALSFSSRSPTALIR